MTGIPILISIEGNIGSGKSTLLRKLRERNPQWHMIDEPVESWMSLKDQHGTSLLQHFYADTPRWAYTFQNAALLTRILMTQKAIQEWHVSDRPGQPIFITERCVNTDRMIFAKQVYKDGSMNALEYSLYETWFQNFGRNSEQPVAYVFVDTPVDVCDTRIHSRNREGEERIPVPYLEKLHTAHQDWLNHPACEAPVFRVDTVSAEPTPVDAVETFIWKQYFSAVD